jgi:hypothetical protein
MATPARKPPPRKPTLAVVKNVPSPTASKVIAKPTPVDAADAHVGRKVREFFEWALTLFMWCVSGLIALQAWVLYPAAGLWGALTIDAVLGLVLILFLARGSR